MIKAILIDDDVNLREGLKSLFKRKFPEIEVVSEAGSVKEAVQKIESSESDVLFLDIQLGDGTGFDVLEILKSNNGEVKQQVIFLTAFEQYAIKAFRFSALDYLLKPIDPEELKHVINKIIHALASTSETKKVELLLENIRKKSEDFNKIILSNSDGMRIVQISDILRCESIDNYTKFFFEKEKSILISKTLKEYDELLSPHNFERVHQSHLINMKKVKAVQKTNSLHAVMIDDSLIPISQRKKENFLKTLKSI